MAKFAKPIDEDSPLPPTVTVNVNNTNTQPSAVTFQQNAVPSSMQATAQAQTVVGLAQTEIDSKIVDSQLEKQDEHWVKAYWRPAMGWLYMAINLMDFIIFPIISMILPVIYKGFGLQIGYTAWQSLSLSNGGMIHIAFGAILGIAAYTRGQEKIAKIGS